MAAEHLPSGNGAVAAASVRRPSLFTLNNSRRISVTGTNGHDQTQLLMAAAAAEGARISEKIGISCPEFGRSMTPPRIEGPKKRTSIFAHLILSLVGTMMFLAVGVWFAFFSRDRHIQRVVGAGIAFTCAVLFTLLGYAAIRKRRTKKEPEIKINPTVLREQRRSMSNSLRKHTSPMSGDELMNQIRRHSTCITIESCEKAIQAPNIQRQAQATVVRTLSPKSEASASLIIS